MLGPHDDGRAGETTGPLPTFLLVGAMKAGTTSLAAWLDAHEDVFVAPQKEVTFFNDPFRFWLGESWYRRQFHGHGGETAVGDATPMISNPIAMQHATRMLPSARILAVLRDPVDRAYAHYWHARSNLIERRSFPRAMIEETVDPVRSRGDHPRDYLGRSRYATQLQALEALFPREAIHIELFDDVRDHPHAVFRRICRFLGVDATQVPPSVGSVHDPRPAFRLPSVELAIRGLGLRRRAPRLTRWLRTANRMPSEPYPPLEPAVRTALVEHLLPDIEAVEAWTGRSLPTWRQA